MSVKSWRQREKEEAGLEEQEQEIRQELKMNKIKNEFGQLSGEELFKPITKRLDKAAKEPVFSLLKSMTVTSANKPLPSHRHPQSHFHQKLVGLF